MRNKIQNGRRAFLKSTVLAGGAATVALGANTDLAEATESVTRTRSNSSRGYHLTAHIEQYYRLIRD